MLDSGPSLVQAAPYIARFRQQYVVIKLGGELFDDGAVASRIAPQLEVLYHCGLKPVLIHGGGKQIDVRCAQAGIAIEKHAGRRVTSPAILQVVLEVVAGQMNQEFCQMLRGRGIPVAGFADGISKSVRCRRRAPVVIDGESVDFGEVGDVIAVDVEKLVATTHTDSYTVPVLPSVGWLGQDRWVNVNADSVAAHVAITLHAQKLIMLSRAPGVMRDLRDAGPIARLTPTQAEQLLQGETVVAGMRAKLEEALRALRGGVSQVHIISGSEPQTLLLEIFTDEGCGTLISE